MKTLILVSVCFVNKSIWTYSVGLYSIVVDGDYSHFDGKRMQQTTFADPLYREMSNIFFRKGVPGEPLTMPSYELRRVLKFPTHEGPIVHCEIWI